MSEMEFRVSRRSIFIYFLAAAMMAGGCSKRATGVPVNYGYKVVKVCPHDKDAFTQGLVFEDGILYEGTGGRGHSVLRKVELETGRVLVNKAIEPSLFGEGITVFGDKIIQLTLDAGRGFVYDKGTFARVGEFSYPTKGWGLTHDGTNLIMSDGSAMLYKLDPQTYERVGQIHVTSQGAEITGLNELEYIDGEIYANIWLTDRIVRISPESGLVTGWIDLTGLLPVAERRSRDNVLNGIAYDAKGGRLFVTGKRWSKLFEIKLVRRK